MNSNAFSVFTVFGAWKVRTVNLNFLCNGVFSLVKDKEYVDGTQG